ncbi:MAG: hypothetical protein ACREP8_07685 [Candidatus Binatia bacterium]
MKTAQWIAIAVAALIVGVLLGYAVWGPDAARLPQAEAELASVTAQMAGFKQKMGELENNLGKMTNDKLNLEKEVSELREALEQATKKRR